MSTAQAHLSQPRCHANAICPLTSKDRLIINTCVDSTAVPAAAPLRPSFGICLLRPNHRHIPRAPPCSRAPCHGQAAVSIFLVPSTVCFVQSSTIHLSHGEGLSTLGSNHHTTHAHRLEKRPLFPTSAITLARASHFSSLLAHQGDLGSRSRE